MKKKYIPMLLAVIFLWNTVPAYSAQQSAGEIEMAISGFKPSILTIEVQEDAEILTLEKAIEKALKYSSTMRNSKRDMEELQKNRDDAAEKWVYSSSNSLAEIMNLLSYDTQLTNSQLSQEVTKAKLENTMKSAYISIINTERELALKELELKNSAMEIAIAETKEKLGLITTQELLNQQLSYEKMETEIENTQKSLEEAYISLNALLGEESSKVYQLSLDPIYEKFEFKGDLESYINTALSTNSNLKQKKNSAELAEQKLKIYSIESGQSYTSLKNDVSTTSLSYRDAKTDLETSIRSAYNNIAALEKSYENNLKELEALKANLEVTKTKWDRKLITDLEMKQAEYKIASMENTILNQIYEHMLLADKFENSDLIY